ncbi:MAG: ABC transporter permease [Candidatus Bipolaricaulia bacterium]
MSDTTPGSGTPTPPNDAESTVSPTSMGGSWADAKAQQERSMARMIWNRFTEHKLGVTGAIIIVVLLFLFIFAEFFSPYDYQRTHYQYAYVPPMLTRIHFDDFRPFVYGLKREPKTVEINGQTTRLPGVWDYQEDKSKKYYIHFFVKGSEYKLLGLIPWDVHLFGVNTSRRSAGQLFLLGTNANGKDVLSRILFAGRVTLGIAPGVVLISFLLGTLLGGISGFFGGAIDTFMQRITEIFMSLPRLALLLVLMIFLNSAGTIPAIYRVYAIIGIMAIVNWALIARVVRGQFLTLRESEYTQAARAVGANNMRIITRHIMPNITSYLVVAATLAVPDIVILESILSFLNFGIQHPLVSWGSLLSTFTQQGIYQQMQFYPWMILPAAFIVLTVLAFNFLGDALRDAVDPYSVVSTEGDDE